MTQRSRTLPTIASLFGLVLLIAACGPIEYVSQVTRKASTAVEAAKAVDADKYSPYYYTLAVEYLHKARVKASSADFEAANRFGRKSEQAAKMAKSQALERAGKPLEEFFPNLDQPKTNLAPLVEEDQPATELAPLIEEEDKTPASTTDADDGDSGEVTKDGDDEEVPPGLGGK